MKKKQFYTKKVPEIHTIRYFIESRKKRKRRHITLSKWGYNTSPYFSNRKKRVGEKYLIRNQYNVTTIMTTRYRLISSMLTPSNITANYR